MTIEPEEIPMLAKALADYPSNGKLDMSVWINARLSQYGLVEQAETKTPCRECGTPRVTYRYHKITPAGRLFMAATKVTA